MCCKDAVAAGWRLLPLQKTPFAATGTCRARLALRTFVDIQGLFQLSMHLLSTSHEDSTEQNSCSRKRCLLQWRWHYDDLDSRLKKCSLGCAGSIPHAGVGQRDTARRAQMRPLQQRLAYADAVMRRFRSKLQGETSGGAVASGASGTQDACA